MLRNNQNIQIDTRITDDQYTRQNTHPANPTQANLVDSLCIYSQTPAKCTPRLPAERQSIYKEPNNPYSLWNLVRKNYTTVEMIPIYLLYKIVLTQQFKPITIIPSKQITTIVKYSSMPEEYRSEALGIDNNTSFCVRLNKTLHSMAKLNDPEYVATPIMNSTRIVQLLEGYTVLELTVLLFEHGLYALSEDLIVERLKYKV